MNGWIKIHRKILENPYWEAEKFTKAQAWIDLLLNANFKDSEFFLRGIRIQVKRGQIARSIDSFCKKWRWSKGKVNRFLADLETSKQITQQKSKLITILTVTNYEEYQANRTTDSKTSGETSSETSSTRIKNDKNEKNVRIYTLVRSYKANINKNAFLTKSARNKIATRLKSFTLEDLLLAIKKFSLNEWRMENNSDKPLSWFFRSDDQIATFLALKEDKKGYSNKQSYASLLKEEK